ncbi:hypothetical protein LPB19_06070 [Marinobacter salinisoli]|uniref:Secreted protein n=1 Tax=Marinobacter salinisoli TaxID=2769486 RepID=A0ABX7MXX7_9GAMM|nr:hypothetical protein [Marinobacter salinisoli]QSP95966.1 hypothetical protein LPB19_06070 [Marinobacter salinisoli]
MKRYGSAASSMLPVLAVVAGLLISTVSQAGDDLDVTMRMVVDDADLMNSVVREIELPRAVPAVSSAGRDKSADRDKSRDLVAKGADQRDEARSAARDAREMTGRNDSVRDKTERPNNLPDAIDNARPDVGANDVPDVRDVTGPDLKP